MPLSRTRETKQASSKKSHPKTRAPAAARSKSPKKYWSRHVTETSDALDLESNVFTKSPHAIALSLKRSAERSRKKKGSPFQAAMSMLTFYENRAGTKLSVARRRAIEAAKIELRVLFGRTGMPTKVNSK